MRALLLGLVLLGAAVMLAQGPARLRYGREVALFNGRDLTGWTYYLADPKVKMSEVWWVDPAEKVLVCKGQPFGYIRTEKDYADFLLTLEWRFNPVTKQAGNSGVLLRIVGPDKIWPKSIEAQLMSGSAGDFWLIDGASLITPPERVDPHAAQHRLHTHSNENPIGQWNRYEILCHGGLVRLKVNGEVLNEGTEAEPRVGKIGLQSEGVEIHFRNVRLRPILR